VLGLGAWVLSTACTPPKRGGRPAGDGGADGTDDNAKGGAADVSVLGGAAGSEAPGSESGASGAPDQVCKMRQVRCSDTGIPQICEADQTRFSDQQPCEDGEICEAETGKCVVACESEGTSQTCKDGKLCGEVDDNCGLPTTCAICTSPETCGGGGLENVCGCTKESDAEFCARLDKSCGVFNGTDNCGHPRSVANCGACDAVSQICEKNVCECTRSYTGADCKLPRFQLLGSSTDFGYGVAVSGDGASIVGATYTVDQNYSGFMWTQSGVQPLLAAGGVNPLSLMPRGISKDGAVVVGVFPGPYDRAFRWRAGEHAVELDLLPGDATTSAEACSANGNVIVGSCDVSPCFWTNGSASEVPMAAGTLFGYAVGVSDDGSVVVGDMHGSKVSAFRWQVGDATALPLGTFEGYSSSMAHGVSGDGQVVVGSAEGKRAFRWSSGTGFVAIADAIVAFDSDARATNFDGTVVIGSSDNIPWVWDSTAGVRPIYAVIEDLGFNTGGYGLQKLNAVSSDGKTLVGGTSTPSGIDRTFVVRLP
jgi:uncharacterized membrane protein